MKITEGARWDPAPKTTCEVPVGQAFRARMHTKSDVIDGLFWKQFGPNRIIHPTSGALVLEADNLIIQLNTPCVGKTGLVTGNWRIENYRPVELELIVTEGK